MKKLGILLLTIIFSTVLAALYGAIHDQVTYSISSEYFTIYKFDQFGFSDWGNNNPRLTTALIGVLATWWVGFYIGIFQGLIGLFHSNYKLMFKYVLNAIFITLGVTVLFGVFGYVAEIMDAEAYKDCCFPYQIKDGKSFMTVGSIHNYGYTGGEIGAVIGVAYQIIMKKRETVDK
ncbi:hypothetical protein [Flavobacterium capsici]|uniref:Signal peptide-containing protein n=1 Tax=Flavobacterium capsici TaxID=3075618 RepID=A0AA96EW23_9FLAO|nr:MULTISPECIES: hypothetical protein [unclassified Flavobacterium]WNM18173.1 hypothetical protein RN608_09120 [Flavobacterium sp. PMR2A8]WNM22224.1 hypothetical protein RN605_02420 [Flavobacterium sp. PMTSA4]